MNVYGFNGSMPGPTIEVIQGDRVRFVVTNELTEDTVVHWHGFELPDQAGCDKNPNHAATEDMRRHTSAHRSQASAQRWQ
jgi:FtsP/CotA-like multicopper oxidase with cupredoxin domain